MTALGSRGPSLAAAGLLALTVAVGSLAPQWPTLLVVLGSAALFLLLARYPFFGLCLTAALVFVGTPSIKVVYTQAAVTQYFPSMFLLVPTALGFLARAAARRGPPEARRPATVLAPFVLAIALLETVAVLWAPKTPLAWGHVATLAFNVSLFALIVGYVRDERRLTALLWSLIGAGLVMCVTMALAAQYDWSGSIPLGWRGVTLNFELFSEALWGRIGGLCSANQAGGYLVFATFLAMGLSRRYRRLGRVGLALIAFVFLIFVVVSGSRGAILGFLGATTCFFLLDSGLRRRIVSRTSLVVVVLLAAVLLGKPSFIDRMLVGFGYSGPLLFSEKKNTSESSSNVSGSGARFRMWKQALSVMADDPALMLLGLGPGGFVWHTEEPEVHSLWLAFFFDLGLLGGLVGLLGLAVLAADVGRVLRRAPPSPRKTLFVAVVVASLAEIGLHSMIDHDLTSPVSRFTWLYLAVLAAALEIMHTTLGQRAVFPLRQGDAVHDPLPVPAAPARGLRVGPAPVLPVGAASDPLRPGPGAGSVSSRRPGGPASGRPGTSRP